MLMDNSEYLRKENETNLEYAMRLIGIKKELKPDDLDWADIVQLLGLEYSPDSLRKSQDTPFGGFAVYNQLKNLIDYDSQEEVENKLHTKLQELQKLKASIADERIGLSKQIKQQSRIENIKQLAIDCASQMSPIKLTYLPKHGAVGSKCALLTLSDFHYGLEIKEFNNEYNSEIFEKRLNILLNECVNIKVENDAISDIVVLGLGDFISGLIHNVIRVESRENVVEQVISVTKALENFLIELSKFYARVDYYDCIGNHSRLYADKDNCLSKESFDILIHYILEQRFLGIQEINIHSFTIDERIGEFEVFGKQYAFCHGNGFSIGTLAKDLSLMTKKFYEAIFIGHIHHLFIEEQNGTLVVANGTFAGNDEFANKLKKTSNPSQNIIILSDKGIEYIKPIKLNVYET